MAQTGARGEKGDLLKHAWILATLALVATLLSVTPAQAQDDTPTREAPGCITIDANGNHSLLDSCQEFEGRQFEAIEFAYDTLTDDDCRAFWQESANTEDDRPADEFNAGLHFSEGCLDYSLTGLVDVTVSVGASQITYTEQSSSRQTNISSSVDLSVECALAGETPASGPVLHISIQDSADDTITLFESYLMLRPIGDFDVETDPVCYELVYVDAGGSPIQGTQCQSTHTPDAANTGGLDLKIDAVCPEPILDRDLSNNVIDAEFTLSADPDSLFINADSLGNCGATETIDLGYRPFGQAPLVERWSITTDADCNVTNAVRSVRQVFIRYETDFVLSPEFSAVANRADLTSDHANILRLYWAAFDREPDVSGAEFWIEAFNGGEWPTLTRIAEHFVVSAEFIETYGELDDAAFVEALYLNILDRPSDDGGREFWLNDLASGARTRGEVLADFSFSQEFRDAYPLPSDDR